MSQSRYKQFKKEGNETSLVPFIKIPKKTTDYYVYFKAGITRFDILSYEYYSDPNYGWLILQANPSLSGLEFDIEDNTLIRIPYPLDTTLTQYYSGVKQYNETYGIE